MKRVRQKQCHNCSQAMEVLYRCKYNNSDWVFLCQECLTPIKEYSDYIYGGTWKARKDNVSS